MGTRERLSATVEAHVLVAGRAAVKAGRADSLSAWVNDALRRQAQHDQRMQAAAEFFAEYEAENGVITVEEMAEARARPRPCHRGPRPGSRITLVLDTGAMLVIEAGDRRRLARLKERWHAGEAR